MQSLLDLKSAVSLQQARHDISPPLSHFREERLRRRFLEVFDHVLHVVKVHHYAFQAPQQSLGSGIRLRLIATHGENGGRSRKTAAVIATLLCLFHPTMRKKIPASVLVVAWETERARRLSARRAGEWQRRRWRRAARL